jgi:hypothetical protein
MLNKLETLSNGKGDVRKVKITSPVYIDDKESMAPGVEVREANLNRDIPGITKIYKQLSVIPHMSGFAPSPDDLPPGIDLERYNRKLKRENPYLGEVYSATEKTVEKYLKEKRESSIVLVAEDGLGIVGTITIDLPGKGGMAIAQVGKWAVSEEQRIARGTKGIGWGLLSIATANALGEARKGGLGCTAVEAGIIHYKGWEKPLSIFLRMGYANQGTKRNNCVSWDPDEGKFLFRDVELVRLDYNAPNYKIDPTLLLNLKR